MVSPRRLRGALVLAILIACGAPNPDAVESDALPDDAVAARTALEQALATRDPTLVSEKARAAAQWEGKDRALDLMLADALANVLMRPAEADPILARWPPSDDPSYRAIVFGKALRSSDWDALAELGAPVNNPVRDQLTIRARHDPSLGEPEFLRMLTACSLLDRE